MKQNVLGSGLCREVGPTVLIVKYRGGRGQVMVVAQWIECVCEFTWMMESFGDFPDQEIKSVHVILYVPVVRNLIVSCQLLPLSIASCPADLPSPPGRRVHLGRDA